MFYSTVKTKFKCENFYVLINPLRFLKVCQMNFSNKILMFTKNMVNKKKII